MKSIFTKKARITSSIALGVVLVFTLCLSYLNATPVTVGNFTVDYVIQSDWGAGATINVTLKNNGSAIQGWSVGWTFSGNQTITNMWNASYTQSGASVTARNMDFNAALSTGGTANFGFNVNYSGTNAAPTSFTVNSSSTTTPTSTTGATPTQQMTPTPTSRQNTPTPTPTRRGTATGTPTPTSRFTPTQAPSSTATVTTTQAPTATPTPTTPSGPVVTPRSVLYVMNYLSPETTTDYTLNDLKNSGFDTVIIFSIDGNASGDLTFFGTPIYTGGVYVGPPGWPARIKSLKTGATSIKRLQFCLAGPFGTYRTYMNNYGTGTNTNWYKNWAKVKEDMGIDAIDFNDENTWDANSLVKLGNMMAAIGYKVTLCPYNNPSVWQNVKSQLGSKVDAVNLQCYDGGRYNNVGTWNTYFGGLKVTPLFWTLHADGTGDTYSSAQTKVRGWKSSYGIISAGAWQYSDMRDFSGGTAAQFNTAIRAGLQ